MKGSDLYRPSTFEARGSAVPFTTPVLAQARVRKTDRDRLEVLVASIADSNATYVIPWSVVDEMFKLTVHDIYLHRAVSELDAMSPEDIRTAALKTAASGLAGTEAARQARRVQQVDEEDRILVNYLLVVAILRTVGMEFGRAGVIDVTSDSGQKIARAAMAEAAGPLNLSGEALYDRLTALSALLGPVGLPNSPKPGRLREQFDDLKSFQVGITEWSKLDGSDRADLAGFCGETARLTLRLAKEALADLDARVDALGVTLKQWDKAYAGLRAAAARVSWLLDGWQFITALWRQAADGTPNDQYTAVDQIFRVLPMIPSQEMKAEDTEGIRADLMLRKRVQVGEDWRTGEVDIELIERIEAVGALALR